MDEWILHIDGDGFFAYCEIARFPHLKGKPVVVGEERGIVCACTYEAKALGITRAMPIFKVREQFPNVTILSCHFDLYEHYANKLAALLEPDVDILERYSIDECFCLKRFPSGTDKKVLMEWLQDLKTKIQCATGLTYSFGLSRTKVLSKIASKRQKPDGCTVIMPDDEAGVLQDTHIGSLWGIGWRLGRRFENMRVQTAYQFAGWDESKVQDLFAEPTQELWHELHGRKMFPVATYTALAKSLQSTRSFTPTTDVRAFVIAELLHNTDVVFTRMRKSGLVTNTVSIFLRTRERQYHSTSITLPHYTDNPIDVMHILTAEAIQLFQGNTRYRSTGITVWNLRLKSTIQEDLFGIQKELTEKNILMQTVDAIRHRYGQGSIAILATMPSVTDRKAKSMIRKTSERYVYGLPLPYLGEVR